MSFCLKYRIKTCIKDVKMALLDYAIKICSQKKMYFIVIEKR